MMTAMSVSKPIAWLAHLLDKLGAVLRRDVLVALRYRAGLGLAAAGAVLEIAGLYYLSRAIGPSFRPEGINSYPFLLVGTGLYTFILMGISSFLAAVPEAQQAGTLEVLMTAPTGGSTVLLLSAVSSLGGKGLAFSAYVAGGLALGGVRLPQGNLLAAGMVLVLSFMLAAALGMGTAAVQLLTQKGSAILWLLGSALWMLAGAMFPISTLPRWLQFLSLSIPITHALTAMRLALFSSGLTHSLLSEIAVLAAFTVLLLPSSVLLFEKAVRYARLSGSLSYY